VQLTGLFLFCLNHVSVERLIATLHELGHALVIHSFDRREQLWFEIPLRALTSVNSSLCFLAIYRWILSALQGDYLFWNVPPGAESGGMCRQLAHNLAQSTGFSHSPSDLIDTPSRAASQEFGYVFPSQPQTGLNISIQTSDRAEQTPLPEH
jgi:hypothetical protein